MRSSHDEGGLAVIETILLGTLLIVPLIWSLGVLSELHRGALASAAAAREAGMEAARSNDPIEAQRAVAGVVAGAFRDHGLAPGEANVEWSAAPSWPRGDSVEVVVSYPVTVLQAPLIGRTSGPSIWVRARHVARIDPYRSREP